MLPQTNAADFPEKLKEAREARNLTYSDLARLLNINPAMPSRYENRTHSCFCRPTRKTWNRLNMVLFGTTQNGSSGLFLDKASVEEIISELKRRGAATINVEF